MTLEQQDVRTESFEGFVMATLPGLVRFAQWVTGPGGDAEDLVHDVLIRVGSRWGAISAQAGDPAAYVRRAIVNAHVSRWRARRRERLVDVTPEHPGMSPAGDIRHGRLWLALHALPRAQRAVIVLRFFEDMTLARTAEVLGVTENTVRTHQQRALQALRRDLVGANEDAGDALVMMAAAERRAAPRLVPAAGAPARLIAEIRTRGRARRAVVAGAALAVVTVLVTAVGWLQWRQVDVVQPVTPPPSLDGPRPTPAVVTTTTPGSRTAAVTTPGGTTPSAPQQRTAPATSSDPAAPAVFDLGGYAFAVRELADPPENLTRTDDRLTPWPINPCSPVTAYPTDAQRIGYAQESTAQDTALVAALATYPDAATASKVLAGFSRAVGACGRVGEPTPAVDSMLVQWSTFETDLGDESVGFLSTSFESAEVQPGDSFIAVRVGASVLVVEVYQSRGVAGLAIDSRIDQVTRLARGELDRLRESGVSR